MYRTSVPRLAAAGSASMLPRTSSATELRKICCMELASLTTSPRDCSGTPNRGNSAFTAAALAAAADLLFLVSSRSRHSRCCRTCASDAGADDQDGWGTTVTRTPPYEPAELA